MNETTSLPVSFSSALLSIPLSAFRPCAPSLLPPRGRGRSKKDTERVEGKLEHSVSEGRDSSD